MILSRALVGTAFLISASTLSWSADLQGDVFVPENEASPHFDWAGPYAGVHLGYGWAQVGGVFDISELDEGFEDGSETTFVDDMNPEGILGGFQAGYNFQSGAFVFGPEIDISFADISGEAADNAGNDIVKANIDLLASLRLRAGVAFDRLLVFATGGLAYANGEFEVIDDFGIDGDENSGKAGIDAWGGVAGGGFEYAFTQNLSFRLEGLYYFFDEETDTSDLTGDSDEGDFVALDGVAVVRAGLNFGF